MIQPWKSKQYAGNALITLGLADAFASFGLFITRKNDGETALKWLGTDDYFVMSALMVGGLLMAWSGRSLHFAGHDAELRETCPAFGSIRVTDGKTSPSLLSGTESNVTSTKTPPVLLSATQSSNSIDVHIQSNIRKACFIAIAASVVFFAMSSYSLLGGFHSTPTPESHIGPSLDNKLQLSVFSLTYGMTAVLSVISVVFAASQARPRDSSSKLKH